MEVVINTKSEDDFNKSDYKMIELMKEKEQEDQVNVYLKERKDVIIPYKKCLWCMSKLSQGQERTGGLIKIMSCFKTWPPEGSIEKNK